MSQPETSTARSAQQVLDERSLGEVSDVLTCVDQAIERATRARRALAKVDGSGNAALAVSDALVQLQRTRKRLVQDTYYAADALRLI